MGELAVVLERRKTARNVKVNGVVQVSEFLFHRGGRQVGEFRKSWQSACLAAGVATMICSQCESSGVEKRCPQCKTARKYNGKIFHSFRRSACRNMSQAGVPQQVAMRISGHKTASMFSRYNIVCTDDLRTALERTEHYRATAANQKIVAIGGSR
jgi:integrase